GKYISKPVLTDADGKVLKENTDYTVEYSLADGTLLNKGSIVEAGREVYVTATGKGNYIESGTLQGKYCVAQYDFKQAAVTVDPQVYTGREIELTQEDIHVKIKGNTSELVFDKDFVIVENSYVNNVKTGTASVQIRGIGNYGGTKTVKFKILKKRISFL
ncbi:MAG: hypothetical protein K2N39_06475, partial [Lachnospiraceae bacterium]|nr:hypothetical protein [Lachnospiraceae bacterium]